MSEHTTVSTSDTPDTDTPDTDTPDTTVDPDDTRALPSDAEVIKALQDMSSEDAARLRAALDNAHPVDAPDPTGGTDEQMAAKQAVNAMGDQDAVNTANVYQYPAGAEVPSAINVRRYPELFSQEVIDSFNVPNPEHEGQDIEPDEIDETSELGDGLNADDFTTNE